MNFVPLHPADVAIAASLVFVHAILSIVFELGLGRQVLVASVRMVVQLVLIGQVLRLLFTSSPAWSIVAATAMILFAGREVTSRQERLLTGWWSYGLGTGSMLLASMLVTLLALLTAIRPDPWYEARFAIPLLGMVLGNTMAGVALGFRTLIGRLVRERASVEARLALGETKWSAARPILRGALRTALLPIVQTMAATGLVFLPGTMTGQILAGVDPEQAVLYQMLLTFLIAGGTALGATAAVLGTFWRLTDARHRLRFDRLGVRRG